MSEPGKAAGADHYLLEELRGHLRDDSTMLEFIADAALDGMWFWDLDAPEHEWMSPSFWRTLGYDPAEREHRAAEWQDLIDPEDLKRAVENFERHCADPSHPYDQVVRYRHASGATVWIRCRGVALRSEDGRPIRMFGGHVDITDRIEAEDRYARERAAMHAILEHTPNLVSVKGVDGALLYGNPSWRLAAAESEMGSGLSERERHAIDRATVIESDEIVEGDGGARHQLTRTFPLSHDDGRIFGVAEVGIDVTRMVGLQQDLARRNEMLEQFVYTASHDLKSPLVTFGGYLEALRSDIKSGRPDDLIEYVDRLEGAVGRMRDTVRDLLDFSRVGVAISQPEVVDLAAALARALEDQASRLSDLGTSIEIDLEVAEVWCDPAHLARILGNLVDNAARYGLVGDGPTLRIESRRIDDRVAIAVEDDGPGIPARFAERAFSLFERLQQDPGGTGVGLALVRRVVEAEGGRIRVEPGRGGRGACFRFTLAGSPDSGSESPETEPEGAAEPGSGDDARAENDRGPGQ